MSQPATGTPRASRCSRVRGRSQKALTPDVTAITGWRARAARSWLTSPVTAAPLCTPPRPPVAKTSMPTAAASVTEAETVVTPTGSRRAAAAPRSRAAILTDPAASRSASASSAPTTARPSRIPVRAGTAPAAATAAMARSRPRRLAGAGRPSSENTVDSRATTGAPEASPSRTSSPTRITSAPAPGGSAGGEWGMGPMVGARRRRRPGTGSTPRRLPAPSWRLPLDTGYIKCYFMYPSTL